MFGFFEAIYAFLARQLGTRNDSASSSGSLHSKITSVANTSNSISSNINLSLGSRTDSPSRAGSVHAKLRNLDASYKTPTISHRYSSSVSSTTPININGSGYITSLYMQSGGSSTSVTITIDGNVLFDESLDLSGGWVLPMNFYFGSNFT